MIAFSRMGLVPKVDEAVAVIDADIQQVERADALNAGDFRAHLITEVRKVESRDILILLPQITKLKGIAPWINHLPG